MQQRAAMAPLQQQAARQQIEMQRRQMADQDALTKAITQYDPEKHTLADIPKLITQNGGSGQAALAAQSGLVAQRQNLMKMGDEQFAQEQKRADLIQGVHDAVTQAPPDQKQQLYQQGLQSLGRAGVDVSKEPLQYPGDDAFAQHLPAIRLHTAIVAEAEKQRELATKEQQAQAGDWKEGGGGTLVNVNPKSPQFGKIVHGVGPVDQQEMNSYLTAEKVPGESLPPAQRTPASFLSWKAKQSPMAMVMGNILPAGAKGDFNPKNPTDVAAKRYNDTGGELPAGFARSPGTTAAIMKRAAELPGGENLAANKATRAADMASLRKVQTQFEQMNAFEGTALRNLDLYAQTAAKIPDLGTRFANVPLRAITGNMIGADNMAALRAARETAATEVAKVLGSATGAGVLTDTQKKDAQDVLDGNLPFSATLAVVNTLKRDMANRHRAYQDDINVIRGRLGASPQESPEPGGGTQGGMIRARDPQGKLHEAPAGTALPQGWTLEK
jgi:hypothetical protein